MSHSLERTVSSSSPAAAPAVLTKCRTGHLRAALRYAERNPVRAGLTPAAEAWEWSSAAAHLGQAGPLPGLGLAFWHGSGSAERWPELLAEPDEEAWLKRIRPMTCSPPWPPPSWPTAHKRSGR
jgi:hypothetical protein